MRGGVLLFVLLLALGAAPSVAQTSDEPSAAVPASTAPSSVAATPDTFFLPEYQDPASETPSTAGNVLGFVVKFGAVLGLIYGVFWLYRRMGGPAAPGFSGTSPDTGMRVKTLGSTHLRGTQTVHLVGVGDRVWVVGSNGKDLLVPLGELTAPESKQAFSSHLSQAETAQEGFDALVDSTLRQVILPRKGEPS